MHKKRGQTYSQPFLYFLIAVVAVVIIIFGYNLLTSFEQKRCDTQYTEFKIKLEESINAISTEKNKVSELKLFPPCGVDRILFVDAGKEILFDSLERFPIIQDVLSGESDDNTFFIKDKKVVKSDYVGSINLKMPYFLCTEANSNIIKLMLHGTGKDVMLSKKDDAFDCTFDYALTIELTEEDITEVFDGIIEALGNDDIRGDIGNLDNKELVDSVETNLTREVDLNPDNITVTIKKSNGAFQYYENIPKCAIEDLQDAIDNNLIVFNPEIDLNISNDPLIMWDFDEDDEEITYTIKDFITPSCLRGQSPGLFGIGLTYVPFNDTVTELALWPMAYNAERLADDFEEEVWLVPEEEYETKAEEFIDDLSNQNKVDFATLENKTTLIKKIVMRQKSKQRRAERAIPSIEKVDNNYRKEKREEVNESADNSLAALLDDGNIDDTTYNNVINDMNDLNEIVAEGGDENVIDTEVVTKVDDAIQSIRDEGYTDEETLSELRADMIITAYTKGKKYKPLPPAPTK